MVYLYIIVALLGLAVGSFLNVVLFRMTSQKRFWQGRSQCLSCGHILAWYELIPVLSYLVQGGKCRQCKIKLSSQYPVIEAITGLLFSAVFYSYAPNLPALVSLDLYDWIKIFILWISISQLVIIFVYDLQYQLIHVIQLRTLQLLGLGWVLIHFFESNQLIDTWITALLSSAIILFIYILTKKQGMGWGDIELFLALGLFIPLAWGFSFFFGAFLIGSIWGLSVILVKPNKSLKQKIAFGPSIILSFGLSFSLALADIAFSTRLWHTVFMV